MFKSCSRCGQIHDDKYKCKHNAPKIEYSRYGTTEEQKLRNTTAWHKKSIEIRQAANYLCEVCRDEGRYNYSDLEVHHITPIRANKERLLDNDNLVCLCVKHHKQADRGQIQAEYLRELARVRNARQ